MANKCEHRTLVENALCKINYCADCGNVHLSLGAMTLHLSGDQFEPGRQTRSGYDGPARDR